jgi:hypothetical protein
MAAQRSRENRDLRDLLYKRLKNSYAIALCLSLCLDLYLFWLAPLSKIFGVLLVTGLLSLGCAYLWRSKELSLSTLRKFELLMLGLGFVGISTVSLLRIGAVRTVSTPLPSLPVLADLNHQLLFQNGGLYFPHATGPFCTPIVLAWSFFMVGYGVLIPNTWRRCALIIFLMMLAELACVAYGVHFHAALRPLFGISMFFSFFISAGFAAISLYGSHKLDLLRGEVLAAMQVGQYSLKRQLGKGGMGEVYLAQHRLLRRPCAVKLIAAERAGDAASLVRFEREVQAMARLTHPNTVEIYDYGRTDEGMFYYAMEYLPGLSAEDFIRHHGVMPPARTLYLLRQICGALNEAHTAGLIHRDIKPAKIAPVEGWPQNFPHHSEKIGEIFS